MARLTQERLTLDIATHPRASSMQVRATEGGESPETAGTTKVTEVQAATESANEVAPKAAATAPKVRSRPDSGAKGHSTWPA